MAGIFNIGTSALLAAQQRLATTSHNIANAVRPEYSRQTVSSAANSPTPTEAGFIGTGVHTVAITRGYDAFLVGQLRELSSLGKGAAAQTSTLEQLGVAMGDASTGLSSAIEDLFAGLNDLASNPASLSVREVVLGRLDALVDRFHSLGDFVEGMRGGLNQHIQGTVAEINSLARDLATSNKAITLATAGPQGQPPNDLLDHQDALLDRLSELIDMSAIRQSNGSVSVFIGNGQSLVLGSGSTSLSTRADLFDASKLSVVYGSGTGADLGGQLTGGELGGSLQARDRVDETRNSLGRIAVALADTMNRTHRQGVDLKGNLGTDLFAVPGVAVVGGANSGTLTVDVNVSDSSQLTASDYLLKVDAAGDFILTRLADGSTQNLGAAPGPFTVDGLGIDLVSGTAMAGDSFLLRPTAGVARGISRVVSNGGALAAAAPILTGAIAGNLGDAAISAGRVVDIANSSFTTTPRALSPPIAIRFVDATTYEVLDNTLPAAPVVLETGIAYASGQEVFPTPGGMDHGYRLTIRGRPEAGDLFRVDYNVAGVGDNRNALALAARQIEPLVGASSSYQAAFGGLIGTLGAAAQSTSATSQAADMLLGDLRGRRDSVSGVNLDEEAANLLRFQQAYEAAAQTIRVANSLIDSLLEAIGR